MDLMSSCSAAILQGSVVLHWSPTLLVDPCLTADNLRLAPRGARDVGFGFVLMEWALWAAQANDYEVGFWVSAS